jgi:hypothetical protein
MSFEDDLNAPLERISRDVDLTLGGHLYTLRFTALDGLTWANETDKYPMRPGIAFDSFYGYDIRALTEGVAPLCGVRVDGNTTTELSDDAWANLFARIDGLAFKNISDALFWVNELAPEQAVEAAKKALASSEATSSLPSNSVSPPEGSTAGNPEN